MTEAVAMTVIPHSQFEPLINEVYEILSKVKESYETAQHNKNITQILMERISAAYSAVRILQEDALHNTRYVNLQKLVQVLQQIRKYAEEITQYDTLQIIFEYDIIEQKFKDLRNKYDNGISLLNFIDFKKFNEQEEDKVLKEDIEELMKFQGALAESMTDTSMDQISAIYFELFVPLINVVADVFRK